MGRDSAETPFSPFSPDVTITPDIDIYILEETDMEEFQPDIADNYNYEYASDIVDLPIDEDGYDNE